MGFGDFVQEKYPFLRLCLLPFMLTPQLYVDGFANFSTTYCLRQSIGQGGNRSENSRTFSHCYCIASHPIARVGEEVSANASTSQQQSIYILSD
jgi:hypothetical protein